MDSTVSPAIEIHTMISSDQMLRRVEASLPTSAQQIAAVHRTSKTPHTPIRSRTLTATAMEAATGVWGSGGGLNLSVPRPIGA